MRNAILYKKLKAAFGEVRTSHEDTDDETYHVCCPFCGDTRQRLSIRCGWGVYDPIAGHNNLGLCYCYNENCVQPGQTDDPITKDERFERQKQLLDHVYHGTHAIAKLKPSTKTTPAPTEPLEWPGKVIRLDKLFAKKPDHPAVTYMLGRGFDPVQLGKEYGFVFCDTVTDMKKYGAALGTILMPIYKDDMLYSWISRCCYDVADKKAKKYYNCPDRPLQNVGFNLDIVAKYSTIVLVEGILDAIKVGPFATCLFTKHLNATLHKKLVRMLQHHGDDAAIIIMLDPEQDKKEKARGMPHQIEVAANKFTEYVNVLRVYLPIGTDPGSMSPEENMRYIQKAARKTKIKLDFEPK